MDFVFDAALDQWHDWATTGMQWLLLNGNYTPDPVGQVWVSDVAPYEVAVANYERQPVTNPTRTVDTAQHRVVYDCDDPDFGYIAGDPPGVSMLCVAKVGSDDSDSRLLAAFDLPSNIGSGLILQPLVSPSGVNWIAPVEADSYTLTFRAPSAGVPAGAQSAWLNVSGATEVTTITWENLPAGVVNIYSEAFGADPWTTLTSPPTSGSMDLPTGTLVTDGPTNISMIPTMPLGSNAKLELTVLGAAAPQETPPDAPWTPEGGFDYWLESNFQIWGHIWDDDPDHAPFQQSDNMRAIIDVFYDKYAPPPRIAEVQLVAESPSNYVGTIWVHSPAPRFGVDPAYDVASRFDVTDGIVWSDDPAEPLNLLYLYVDIWEHPDTWNIELLPPENASLKIRAHVEHASVMPPSDWPGTPGNEIQFESHPL